MPLLELDHTPADLLDNFAAIVSIRASLMLAHLWKPGSRNEIMTQSQRLGERAFGLLMDPALNSGIFGPVERYDQPPPNVFTERRTVELHDVGSLALVQHVLPGDNGTRKIVLNKICRPSPTDSREQIVFEGAFSKPYSDPLYPSLVASMECAATLLDGITQAAAVSPMAAELAATR